MILKTLVLGLVFWVLTLLFPSIDIYGFWTIIGTVFLFSVFNVIYQFTLGILLLPLRVLTLDFVSWVVNIGIVYLLANIFNKFTIADGSFWIVLLFTGIYTIVRAFILPKPEKN